MSEKPHIVGKLELACRGCDFILPHSGANKVLNADFKNQNEEEAVNKILRWNGRTTCAATMRG